MLSRRAVLRGCAACATLLASPAWADEGLPPFSMRLLADGIWVHTSWQVVNDQPWPSNGAVVIGEAGVVLIDTAWTPEDTATLLDRVDQLAPGAPKLLAITHAHDDRMAGLMVAHARGVRSIAHEKTVAEARARGLGAIESAWKDESHKIYAGKRVVELFRPGHAHSRDNTVAFVPDSGFLVGGCMIRAAADTNLGYTGDANIKEWRKAARKVLKRYGKDARIVVPGHGDVGDTYLIDHTIALADAAARRGV